MITERGAAPEVLYAATDSGGLYRTSNDGETYHRRNAPHGDLRGSWPSSRGGGGAGATAARLEG